MDYSRLTYNVRRCGHKSAGSQWCALQAALDDPSPFTATLRAASGMTSELKHQLRALLHYHCGVNTLRTRQMMMDLQAL